VKFSAHLSLLFAELPFHERFAAAAAAGFGAVEWWWPRGEETLAANGVRTVLMNFDAGDMAAGERGLLSDADREGEFRANVPIALALGARLGCERFNALVGHESAHEPRRERLERAVANVRWAADRAAAQGAEVLIEPLNRHDNGPYLVSGTDEAIAFIDAVGRPNVRLLFDVYQAHRSGEDVVAALRAHIGRIAHIQIADSPGRHEPGTGEIDFPRVFAVLEQLGYDGYIGLEYRPSGSTEESLAWLRS
jgi:hydroxypyruvate isomerase